MKLTPILFAASFYALSALSLSAQDSLQEKKLVYKVIFTDVHSVIHRGNYLQSISDSVLLASEKRSRFSLTPGGENGLQKISYTELGKVKFQRPGAAGRGVLFGGLTGVFAGVVIGLAGGDDPPGILAATAKEKAVILGAALGVVGVITGAIIGSLANKKFIIHGRKEKFRHMQEAMNEILVH